MTSGKCVVFFFATVLVCHMISAADSVSSSASSNGNGTLTNKPAVPGFVPAVEPNNHVNATVPHLRVRGVGGAVACGAAAEAAMSILGGLFGGRF